VKHVIAGTAGHIDHGKTALVKALTGIDTDRLAEEKRRGITIDLGFAHMEPAPGLRLGFVDVPGHERFVKNMLAGVGGIDLVLFVIAADESIKPQTREHFDICRLLGIRRGVVALTKADLVEPDILDLVRLETEEFVAGSFLEGAPVVAVSATAGTGLRELRAALARVAAQTPEKNAAGWFRLPVDRVFSMKGFGTVATGTLISGAVDKEQEVEAYPLGRRLRVRGVQVHGESSGRAVAGQRTALNLADVEPGELWRGVVLSEPGRFRAVTRVDCALDMLASARPLKNGAPVHFHAGTAEIEAQVRFLEGERAFARLVLREPALLLPGDRFILRSFSPVVTIGGGTVLDWGETRYHGAGHVRARLEELATARVGLLVREARYGLGIDDLVARTGWTEAEIAGAGAASIAGPRPWYVDQAWLREARVRLVDAVRAFHAAQPLQAGVPRQNLRALGIEGAPPFLLDALLGGVPEVVCEGEIVRLRTHKVVLKEDEERARGAIEAAFAQAGLAVPPVADVLAASGVEPARARTLLEILLREKRLARVSADLVFHRAALDGLRARVAAHRGERIGVATFKEWTGLSRKYAIPLLEYLDRERVTRREGDQRVVL
jgi:selenocysteine-specific elongation factor